MIKVSKLADYAVVVLAALAGSRGEVLTASKVSEQTRLPEPTVSKVLKLLSKADLVESVRGANGGYRLTKPTTQLPVSDILSAIEGPVSLTACVEGSTETCDYSHCCPVRGRWDDVNVAIRVALESITLADMITKPTIPGFKTREELYERL